MAIGAEHLEADMYFIDEKGNYQFNPEQLSAAHRWCYYNTAAFLSKGIDVVVSNTFTTMKEMEQYLDLSQRLGVKLDIVEMRTQYGSIHSVPEATMEKMRNRWATLPEDFNVKVVQ
jgi:uncharacterized protein YxeA